MRSFALLSVALLAVACSADPSPPDAPPMTFSYACAHAKDCPMTQPTMLGSSTGITMVVHGERADAGYVLRSAAKEILKVSAHTEICGCSADDLATDSGSCPDGQANVCAHRFIVDGLLEGDTSIEVVDGDRVVASTPISVRKAASVDVSVAPADVATRAADGSYEVKAGEKLQVTAIPKSADGQTLRYSGSGVSYAVLDGPAVAHDSIAPGPIEIVRAVAPGTGTITVTSGDAKTNVSLRVIAP